MHSITLFLLNLSPRTELKIDVYQDSSGGEGNQTHSSTKNQRKPIELQCPLQTSQSRYHPRYMVECRLSPDDTVCEQDSSSLMLPFAIDAASGAALPEELELFLAWRMIERKHSRAPLNRAYTGAIEALVKAYYPLWAFPFGDQMALLDPVVLQPCAIEYGEPPSVDGFIDHLQASHSKRPVFRNILMAHQNTFAPTGSSKTLIIEGLLKRQDVAPIVEYLAKSGSLVLAKSLQDLSIRDIGDKDTADAGVRLTAVIRTFAEGLKQLELALAVLETETDHQILELEEEIEGVKAEFAHEIHSTEEILRQSVNKLVKRKDAEVEIVASRFSEIKDILTSDISNFKKVHASLIREGGYLSKMIDARVGEDQCSRSRLLKKLLGDYPKRLKILENEVEKIHRLTELVEKEKGRQLVAVEGLYDELIKARSKITSDLQIDRDIEVNRRLTEIEELSEMETMLREKINSLIEATKSQFKKTDWLVPNSLSIQDPCIIFIPLYIAYCPTRKREERFVICAPGFFSQSLSPAGRAYEFEDRFKPISYQSKALFEVSLPAKILRCNEIQERIVRLAEEMARSVLTHRRL